MASPASKFVGEGFVNHGAPVQKGIRFGIEQTMFGFVVDH